MQERKQANFLTFSVNNVPGKRTCINPQEGGGSFFVVYFVI